MTLTSLEEVLQKYPRVLVSLSGGIDSSVVAAVAARAKGDDALAVTLTGPSLPTRDMTQARSVAERAGIRLLVVPFDPLSDPDYVSNTSSRCYFCRRQEGHRLFEIAQEMGFEAVADGVHKDDLGTDRPGLKAMDELGMRHPLVEAGMGKADVRAVGKELGLPNWETPSNACLASRVIHGTPIRATDLSRIDQAEEYLTALGFPLVRVRTNGTMARVEVAGSDLERLADPTVWDNVLAQLNRLGFASVAPFPVAYASGGRGA
jgi:uncharacterized protein